MKLAGKMKLAGIALMSILIMMLAACGSKEEPNDTKAKSGEKPAAKDEKIVVYTAGPKGLAEKIQAEFEKKSGIKVEQFQGTTGKILSRLEAEKNNPKADVVIVASWPSAVGMKKDGWTQAYADAKNADKLVPEWVDSEKHFFGYSASALGIVYNTDLVKTAPKDWNDLTGADWKDQVNFPDPTLSGSAVDFISGYLNDKGDEGWKLFEDIKKNGAYLAGANAEALDPVVTGSKKAVIAGVDYMAYSAKEKGEAIDIIYPESGTVINPRPAMILKDAPNVDGAKQFIDFLLSDEGQKLTTDAKLIPGRADIQADGRPGKDDIPLLKYDWKWMMEHGDEVTEKFMKIYK